MASPCPPAASDPAAVAARYGALARRRGPNLAAVLAEQAARAVT